MAPSATSDCDCVELSGMVNIYGFLFYQWSELFMKSAAS